MSESTTEHRNGNEPESVPASADADYRAAYAARWESTVEALTAAVHLTHPGAGPLDFAGFIASALAAVAANVGSVDRVLAGRPGSWEAGLVEQLLRGTVGWDEEHLVEHRTEPIVIHLNVARLMQDNAWDHGRSQGPYENEMDKVNRRHSELGDDDDCDAAAEEVECAQVEAKWAARYTEYAQAFTAAVMAAADRIEGLRVPVRVKDNTDPEALVGFGPAHPGESDVEFDPIVWHLWETVLSTVPLPESDGES